MQFRTGQSSAHKGKGLARRLSRAAQLSDNQHANFSANSGPATSPKAEQVGHVRVNGVRGVRQEIIEKCVPRNSGRAHVVVLGNAKGGTGKSTIAMHLIVALLQRGYSVASLDLDGWQGSLSRYIENRKALAESTGATLAVSSHMSVQPSDRNERPGAQQDENFALDQALVALADHDFLVIDTPGSDSLLSRAGHSLADTLITPLNDSFLDLDLLVRISADGQTIISPSKYSELVWKQRQIRATSERPALDWIVLCNRLTHIDARNKREVVKLLERAAERVNFRLAPGFGERVIFRELFLKGLTLLDLPNAVIGVNFTLSHLAARQEIRALLNATDLFSKHMAQSTYVINPNCG